MSVRSEPMWGQPPSAVHRGKLDAFFVTDGKLIPHYPSFAVIEIFAFNTFDTGQPFSAASAYF
jgi:hypothetical protein